MIRILVDSTADYQMKAIKEKNLDMVPLSVNVGEKSYKDEFELERSKVYEFLLDGKETVTTSQPSPQDFLDVFEQVKENKDEMICILLSSALSGTYQSASIAKEMVEYDKIYLIDSKTVTIANMIMADHALQMIKAGKTALEIVDELEQLKSRVKIYAVVDTLKYLCLGGRVSRTTAVIGDAVNVKPAIEVTAEGTVGMAGKYLGIGRAQKDMVKRMQSVHLDPDYPLYLIYSYGMEHVEKLKKNLEAADFTVDGIHQLGATIGVHVGPGAFGVIYVEQ